MQVPDGASLWVAEASHEISALAARIAAAGSARQAAVTAQVCACRSHPTGKNLAGL